MLTDNQKRFLDALSQTLGVKSKAAHMCNMTRQCHYDWMSGSISKENAAEYKAAYEETNEEIDDFVEDTLLQRITESDAVLLWVAKTRLHKRGYVEKQEVKNDHGEGGLKLTVVKRVTNTPQIKDPE